jgi:hypothetical protein
VVVQPSFINHERLRLEEERADATKNPALAAEPGWPNLEPLVLGANCNRFAGSKCPIKIKSNAAIAQKWGG